MKNPFTGMSRLKKKLMLYFLLISIVSVSVSAEIILEVSSKQFHREIQKNILTTVHKSVDSATLKKIEKDIASDNIFAPVYNLRNRMVLLLLVVSACIIAAFFLFTRDIVSPMDGIVDATKRIVEGDLTVKVPVISEDEIGQIAGLINTMNEKLLDMIIQVKQDVSRHKDKITAASHMISEMIENDKTDAIIQNKKMKVSDFINMVKLSKNVISLLEIMTTDLSSLQTFINMYKTYSIKTELSQDEIEEAINNYTRDYLTEI